MCIFFRIFVFIVKYLCETQCSIVFNLNMLPLQIEHTLLYIFIYKIILSDVDLNSLYQIQA